DGLLQEVDTEQDGSNSADVSGFIGGLSVGALIWIIVAFVVVVAAIVIIIIVVAVIYKKVCNIGKNGIVNSQNHGFLLKGIRAFAYNSVGQEVKLSGSAVSGLCLTVQKNLPVVGGNMILLFSTLLAIDQERITGSEQEVAKAMNDVKFILQTLKPHIIGSPNGRQIWIQVMEGLGQEVAERLKSVYGIDLQ
ncbi:MAG: hypothetical protein EZS28_010237, partial [Streblomastix strix]